MSKLKVKYISERNMDTAIFTNTRYSADGTNFGGAFARLTEYPSGFYQSLIFPSGIYCYTETEKTYFINSTMDTPVFVGFKLDLSEFKPYLKNGMTYDCLMLLYML